MTEATEKKRKTYPLCLGCKTVHAEDVHVCTHFLELERAKDYGEGAVRCKCSRCRREEALRVKFDFVCKDTPDFTWKEFMDHIDGKMAAEERKADRALLQRETSTAVMHLANVHGHGLKIRFFFLRCNENNPVVTVAIGKVEEGYYYRGISICHPKDNPDKRRGKLLALLRLNAALQGHNLIRNLSTEVSVMLRDEMDKAACNYLDDLYDQKKIDGGCHYIHVAQWKVHPLEMEKRLFRKPLPKNDGDPKALAKDAT